MEEGGGHTPRWRGGRTDKGNPPSTRLTPSRKPTRSGSLRHSHMQEAATGHILTWLPAANPPPGWQQLMPPRCSRPHHPALADGASLGSWRSELGRKRGSCDGSRGSTRRCSWHVDPPVALRPSLGDGCHLPVSELENQISESQSLPTGPPLPNMGSVPAHKGTEKRKKGAGDPFPWGAFLRGRFPLGVPSPGHPFLLGRGSPGDFFRAKSRGKSRAKSRAKNDLYFEGDSP